MWRADREGCASAYLSGQECSNHRAMPFAELHDDRHLCGSAEKLRLISRTGARRTRRRYPIRKAFGGHHLIISAAEYERLKELDRLIRRLDDMSDEEIEEMFSSSIPPRYRYSISDIED
jgi:hypothetical protein